MKDIKGYEGLYAVTSCGKVWSYRKQRFLNPTVTNSGYLQLQLFNNGEKKHCYVHRLVAETYISNPLELPQVNHKDENKMNNCINNLEWIGEKDNNNYGTRNKRISVKNGNLTRCIETGVIYHSAREAGRVIGLDGSVISKCCKGQLSTAGGYHWEYVEEVGADA